MAAAPAPADKVRAFVETRVRYAEEHRDLVKIYHSEFGNFGAAQVNKECRSLYLEQVRMLEAVLEEAAATWPHSLRARRRGGLYDLGDDSRAHPATPVRLVAGERCERCRVSARNDLERLGGMYRVLTVAREYGSGGARIAGWRLRGWAGNCSTAR